MCVHYVQFTSFNNCKCEWRNLTSIFRYPERQNEVSHILRLGNHSKQGRPSDTYENNKFLSLSLFLPFRVEVFYQEISIWLTSSLLWAWKAQTTQKFYLLSTLEKKWWAMAWTHSFSSIWKGSTMNLTLQNPKLSCELPFLGLQYKCFWVTFCAFIDWKSKCQMCT